MPPLSWIEALRQYNAGMPSWCIPRRGTPAYEMIARIRQGEKPKSFKELTEELERKTGGKPKSEKKSMTVNLTEQEVEVPTTADKVVKTDAKELTGKMSTQKTMAVIQPTYVAEGGSKKEEKAAEGGSKSKFFVRYNIHDAFKRAKQAYKDYDDAERQRLFDEMKAEHEKALKMLAALEQRRNRPGGLTEAEAQIDFMLKDDLITYKRALKEIGDAIQDDEIMKRQQPEKYAAGKAARLKKIADTKAKAEAKAAKTKGKSSK